MEFITFLEIIGTITGLTHLWLLTRQKISAWIFGIICVSIYMYISYDAKYYSDAILNGCFFVLNVFGWYNWARKKVENEEVKVTRLSSSGLSVSIAIIVIGTLLWGWFMSTKTDASIPYPDAFTTVASLTAQYLLTQKKIDNWIIWMVVNVVAIPMYIYKGLYITAGLFFVYLLLCISGFIEWRKEMKEEKRKLKISDHLIN